MIIRNTIARHTGALLLSLPLLLAACAPIAGPVAPPQASEPTSQAAEEATEVATVASPSEAVDAGQALTSTTESTESDTSTGCLAPGSDNQLVSGPAAGYCFLMPANFERSPNSDAAGFHLGIYGPVSTAGPRERAFVDVTVSTTQTLDAIAQSAIDDVLAVLPAFTPTQQSLTWGGIPAIELSPMPGQELSRKVLALTNDKLYTLTYVPLDPSQSEANAEMEQLYALMAESFRFITPTVATSSETPVLSWEGDIDGACTTLTIDSDGVAAVGPCGEMASTTAPLSVNNPDWEALQQQFGHINAETPTGKIVFHGTGFANSDAWAQAMATWASFTAMETQAGRTSAALRTALAWQLSDTPEHSGQCSQLVVLAYGYAYANQIPCEGSGQSTPVASGWLNDYEMDTFTDWINDGARVEDKAGYLDAKGSTPLTPEQVGGWANAVYIRMLQ